MVKTETLKNILNTANRFKESKPATKKTVSTLELLGENAAKWKMKDIIDLPLDQKIDQFIQLLSVTNFE